MSFTGFDDLADVFDAAGGWMRCEMVGNGLKAREEGNEGLRFATMRWAAGTLPDCESARGEETAGREYAVYISTVTRVQVDGG